MRMKKIYCPCNGWDCPYFKNGECGMDNPIIDCDDFGLFYDKPRLEEVMTNETRTAFED